jgi:hypothetical protein
MAKVAQSKRIIFFEKRLCTQSMAALEFFNFVKEKIS